MKQPNTPKTPAPAKATAPVVRNCGSCRWWDADHAKNKAGRVRADKTARCQWPTPPLPASAPDQRISPTFMLRDDGADCPCWQARPETAPEAAATSAALVAQMEVGSTRLAERDRLAKLLHEAYPHLRGTPPGLPAPRRSELLVAEIATVIDVSPESYR